LQIALHGFPAVIAGITGGLVIEGISRAIDASKATKGEGSPNENTESKY